MYYSYLEEYIIKLYAFMKISEPYQLNCAEIAQKLGIKLHYGYFNMRYANYIVIKKSTKQKEWQDFGHEVCHFLQHEGNQLEMHSLFFDFQEWQANCFAYHFCVPTFMLEKVKEKSVYNIMDLFNVEYQFAFKRLEMYERKMIHARAYR